MQGNTKKYKKYRIGLLQGSVLAFLLISFFWGGEGHALVNCGNLAANGPAPHCRMPSPELCGNGKRDLGEECDDGNRINTDNCTNYCINGQCGDGFKKIVPYPGRSEQCDDGNNRSGDGCTNDCREEVLCGNGHINPGEACDDGNRIDTDRCTNKCQHARCGDGSLLRLYGAGERFSEECDDGNRTNGDGCSSGCQRERQSVTPSRPVVTPSRPTPTPAPRPSPRPTPTSPTPTPTPRPTPTTVPTPLATWCGDGVRTGTEQCDDGNRISTDSCTNACRYPYCGDRIISRSRGEECDDGDTRNGDGCTSNCKIEHRCGDGKKTGHEECDDGNRIETDTCTNACRRPNCGDGIVTRSRGEECDGGEACTAFCKKIASTSPPRPDIQPIEQECGDGKRTGDEECDDGNQNDTDLCTNECRFARCGGIIYFGKKECDDGNNIDGDGCSKSCKLEDPPESTSAPLIDPESETEIEPESEPEPETEPESESEPEPLPIVEGPPEDLCGDGVRDEFEQCDDANDDNEDHCTTLCEYPRCGDGIVTESRHEVCDDGNTNNDDECPSICRERTEDDQLCGKPMDVVFVVNTENVMAHPLENLKSQAQSYIEKIKATSGGDYRLALVTFVRAKKDKSGKVIIRTNFAAQNEAAFRQKLSTVGASRYGRGTSGGGHGTFKAMEIASNLPFRPEAGKMVVLISNAFPAGEDGLFGQSDRDRIAHLTKTVIEPRGIRVSGILPLINNLEVTEGKPTLLNGTIPARGWGRMQEAMEEWTNGTEGVTSLVPGWHVQGDDNRVSDRISQNLEQMCEGGEEDASGSREHEVGSREEEGNSNGTGTGTGNDSGSGSGNGTGTGTGTGTGNGSGSGNGSGDGSGDGSGSGNGSGNRTGTGTDNEEGSESEEENEALPEEEAEAEEEAEEEETEQEQEESGEEENEENSEEESEEESLEEESEEEEALEDEEEDVSGDCGDAMDVVFVVDRTGSMDPVLSSLKQDIKSYADKIESLSGGDYRLGLVTFADHPNIRTQLDFSSQNKSAFLGAVGSISPSSGGFLPESSSEGVKLASQLSFREKATKLVILLTDAPPGGKDDTHDESDIQVVRNIGKELKEKQIRVVAVQSMPPFHSHPVIRGVQQTGRQQAENALRLWGKLTDGHYTTSLGHKAAAKVGESITAVCEKISSCGYAKSVEAYSTLKNGEDHVTGPPDGKVVEADGWPGYFTLKMEQPVIDKSGADLAIHVVDFWTGGIGGDGRHKESYRLYGSADGEDWRVIGDRAPTSHTPNQSEVHRFDIAGTEAAELPYVAYLKVENVKRYASTVHEGPDVDSAQALHCLEEEEIGAGPSTPIKTQAEAQTISPEKWLSPSAFPVEIRQTARPSTSGAVITRNYPLDYILQIKNTGNRSITDLELRYSDFASEPLEFASVSHGASGTLVGGDLVMEGIGQVLSNGQKGIPPGESIRLQIHVRVKDQAPSKRIESTWELTGEGLDKAYVFNAVRHSIVADSDFACGNGRRENSEQCDDQNQVDGDGCSRECRIEFRVRED